MSSLRRRAATVFAATTLAVAGGLTLAPAASAASSCYASSCTGLDPASTTCQYDAYTARYGTVAGRGIELRYSPSCRAVWARSVAGIFGDKLDVQNSNGTYRWTMVQTQNSWTTMVNDANVTAHACLWVQNGSEYNCTIDY
ncbi:DUF2690 domain-containing protein [Kitasatospora sp. NPDC056181]|uniref:DUF2690 domain-containing protein n=1 Tax=Kitasatospora sp. NPDC056181 TaxID=3345737 RepID=UPI0035E1D3DE